MGTTLSPDEIQTAGLVGREPDVERLRAFLDGARASGGSLLLSGGPGMGKTVLLDLTAEMAVAQGFRVVRASGSEFLTDLSFSTLSTLLQPLLPGLADLDAAQKDAATAMLGLEGGAVTDALLGSNAVLSLLRRTAAERPLLLLVDDVHWADRATAGVLGFIARRLAYTRVGLLAAYRPGVENFLTRLGCRSTN
jgi:predicted ATPase